MVISPPQAWSMLQSHADADVKSLRLSELRNHENQEEIDGSFVATHTSSADVDDDNDNDNNEHLLILDWSRQRMTLETINHLLRLCTARRIRDKIRDLAWGRLAPGSKLRKDGISRSNHGNNNIGNGHGHNNNHNHNNYTGEYTGEYLTSPTVSFAHDSLHERGISSHSQYNNQNGIRNNNNDDDFEEEEEGGSMHLALRAPANKGLTMRDPYSSSSNAKSSSNVNALEDIHRDWKRIQSLTESIRHGSIRGAAGRPLCDVLVVSTGGTVVPHALEFVYRALMHDDAAEMASSVDYASLISVKPTATGRPGGSGNGGDAVPPSKSGESMASGVINMVTTPFKSRSKSNQNNNYNNHHHHHNGSLSQSNPKNPSVRKRKLKVLTSIDPSAFKEALSELSPATTMIVTLSLDAEKDNECREITLAVKNWLLSGLLMGGGDADNNNNLNNNGGMKESGSMSDRKVRMDGIVQKHMFLVTGNKDVTRKSSSNVFLLPRHSRCEAFGTFSAAGLLPLSLVFGWNIVSSLLSGAHDMDQHFVDTNPRHNFPILLSLVDLWNDAFLKTRGRIMSPYVQSFGSYPGFVAALENKVLNGSGKESLPQSRSTFLGGKERPSPVIDGGDHALYNQYLSHEPHSMPAEFILAIDPSLSSLSDSAVANHDRRICSLFAHADTLAFGGNNGNNRGRFEISSPGSPPMIQSVDSMMSQSSHVGGDVTSLTGNQPSTLIVCGTCDAFTCGQLIALAEHRALVKAWLWDIEPFSVAKSSIQEEQQEYISEKLHQMYHLLSIGETLEGADDPYQNGASENEAENNGGRGMHSATNTVLKHYATRMQKHRHHSMPRTPLRGGNYDGRY